MCFRGWLGHRRNESGSLRDMTHMTRLTSTVVLAMAVAVASVAATQATSSGDPGAHQVRYTVTTGQEATINVYYLASEPPSQASYDANPDAYLRNDRLTVAPGSPWVFETTLNDTSWAYVRAGGAAHYYGAPNPHCDIAIDGQVVTQQDGDTVATCELKAW
jgi:hypothetical protein